ncbi:MAG: hypothetical protein LKJ44_08035 [Bifidobacteriaceae bacterium]|nr:hypothetical protein [Bifidobacteriaceae bacterium]MCI1979633.1 hypothetical protein [Bifidobacteriaceae bacterium]
MVLTSVQLDEAVRVTREECDARAADEFASSATCNSEIASPALIIRTATSTLKIAILPNRVVGMRKSASLESFTHHTTAQSNAENAVHCWQERASRGSGLASSPLRTKLSADTGAVSSGHLGEGCGDNAESAINSVILREAAAKASRKLTVNLAKKDSYDTAF